MKIINRFQNALASALSGWSRKSGRGNTPSPPSDGKTRQASLVFEHLLKSLSCQFEVRREERFHIYQFDYQGGHFRLPIPVSGIETATLEFPFMFDADLKEVNAVRALCNEYNLMSRISKFVYTYDEERNKLCVHIFTPLCLFDGMPHAQPYLQAILESQFQLRREFTNAYHAASQKDASEDKEQRAAYERRLNYLLREQEMSHQTEQFQLRRAQTQSLLLADVLRLCFGLNDLDYDCMKAVSGDTLRVERDAAAIRSLDLKAATADTTYQLLYRDPNCADGFLRQIQVDLRTELDDDTARYVRLTAIWYPASFDHHSTFVSGRNGVDAITFIVAIDKLPDETYHREYEFVWSDAIDKLNAGHYDQLSEEQKFLLDADTPDVGFYLFRGRQLYTDKRYYEAIDYLSDVYFYMNDNYDDLAADQQRVFREICFIIGFCYMELQLYAEAYYYLDIIHDVNNIRFAEEYVNCLVNAHDFRALDMVNRMMSHVDNYIRQAEDNGDDVDASLVGFKNFLRRRQVYVLINRDELDKAEQACQQMLDEPENSDFAIGELAYIQRLQRADSETFPLSDAPPSADE